MAKAILAKLSVEQLQSEIKRRNGEVRRLLNRRKALAMKIAALDEAIARAGAVVGRGGSILPPGRKRAKNSMSLVEALRRVLKGKQLSVGQCMDAVAKIGYISVSPSFRVIVNQALTTSKYGFKRVSRGIYTYNG